jgi:hypothetical protein
MPARSTNSAPGPAASTLLIVPELGCGMRNGTIRKERTPERSAIVMIRRKVFMMKL